ncbi:hypothetical protein FQR65_LT06125 [Abscondita terminalis]|nr:hypothetical protein FQR65_LT06125 [Abscondita terminalis]
MNFDFSKTDKNQLNLFQSNRCQFEKTVLNNWFRFFTDLKDYGDSCEHHDECYDARMICIEGEDSTLKCACDRFHAWNGSASGCVPIVSLQQIMNETVIIHNTAEEIEEEQENLFRGPMYAGYFMMAVLLLTGLVILIFCVYVRRKDRELEIKEHSPIKYSKRSLRNPRAVSFI